MESDATQVFMRDGIPIYFVFHNSIRNRGAIKALAENIWAHGGEVVDSDDGADILLINSTRPGASQRLLQSAYDCHPDEDKSKIWVREMSFVDQCIKCGSLDLEPPPKRPVPGLPPGRGRIAFTQEDEENLCEHLARTLPDPTLGGRQSLMLYKSLVSMTTCLPDVYSWATRHTAQSWREHYKKNRERLDARIAEIVAEIGVNPKAFFYQKRESNSEEPETEEDQEEANKLADNEEAALEAQHRENMGQASTSGKELAEEDGHDENADIPPVPKPKPQRRKRRIHVVPNDTNEAGPSQTLVNAEPPLQPIDQDDGIVSDSEAAPEGSKPQNLPLPTHTLDPPTPSAKPATVEEPPYRNTRYRSRSRSVSVNPAPEIVPKRRGRKPSAKRAALRVRDPSPMEDIQEASPEAEELHSDREHGSLFSDTEPQQDTQLNAASGQLQEATNVPDKRARAEDDESEDDRQVRDILEKVGENESAPVPAVERTPPPPRRGPGRPRKQTPAVILVPGTPARGRGGQRKKPASVGSMSSDSVVPIDGSRASAHKKKRAAEETYNTPFKPIPGTEAARKAKRMAMA
ncbi:hypothetical protein FB446DRAFT_791633 [Lentinula raphanica]|nr:hypothetical protein FB446DRAFT_791633 [Lentinula raphanica]